MIKTVTLLTRRADLSFEDFHRHWRDVHAPLVLALPGVRRYLQCRPLMTDGAEPAFDGIAEVYYDDRNSMQKAFDSPAYAELLADEPNFMGPTTKEAIFLTVEEDELL